MAATVIPPSTVPAGAGTNAYNAYVHPRGNSASSKSHRKVTIVGCGAVGTACAVSILSQRLCSEMCLIDVATEKCKAEVLDLQHGMGANQMPATVYGGSDLSLTRDSHLCLVAAGVRQRVGESRRELLNRNARLLAPVFQDLVRYSPNCVLLVVSNPCDAMTFLAQRVTGLPSGRVLGSGTVLDSSRFRSLLAERLGVPIPAVHAHVIGEHGDQSVSVWSSANIFGTPLRTLYPNAARPNDPDNFAAISERVVTAAAELIKAKGYTSWGIGLCCASLARAILHDERTVLSVATIVPAGHALCAAPTDTKAPGRTGTGNGNGAGKGFDLKEDVAMSLPCEVDGRGVRSILKIALDAAETEALQATSHKLLDLQRLIDFASLPKPSPELLAAVSAAAGAGAAAQSKPKSKL